MNKRSIVLVHASRAAVEPVTQYYARMAPELEATNLLDDGVMRLLAAGDMARVICRLNEMITTGRDTYGAELAVLTCSAATRDAMREIRATAGIPVVKIDEPMAKLAVRAGIRIGVVATFGATVAVTRTLIEEAALEAGKQVEVITSLADSALEALLAGNPSEHDSRLLEAISSLADHNPDAVVLAQVSMARLAPEARRRVSVPVFHSLESSLEIVRFLMAERG